MPNWCWNHLEVSGDEIQLREFVEKSTIDIEKVEKLNGLHMTNLHLKALYHVVIVKTGMNGV